MPSESVPAPDSIIAALREAVRVSPNSLDLRRNYGDMLLGYGKAEDAETEYREALSLFPQDPQLKVGLASAFYQQGKYTASLVMVEDLMKSSQPPARGCLLYVRLLVQDSKIEEAVIQYKKAVKIDPSVADSDLEERLGIFQDEEESEIVDGKVRNRGGGESEKPDLSMERPTVTFEAVGGIEGVKEEIQMKIIHPLAHPEIYKAYGKAVGGGILMYGPPGCGKTHLARATAGEVKAGFISVGINHVLDMWLGQSERNLHEIFEQARNHKPCVLFFDEVDALGASRSDMRQSAGRQLINQFLSELDGIKTTNDGVLILAATNVPWYLDSAFRRPGRFDRIIFVPPPDAPARETILRILLKGKPTQDIDHQHISKKTDGFSGADLKTLVDVSVEGKLQQAMKKGVPEPLTTKDLLSALKKRKPSTKEWFSTARNYALYSNQGGFYDEILPYLNI